MAVANHGGDTIGIPDEQGADEHQDIHDNCNGRYAVLPHIVQHRQVKQQSGDAGHQRGGQLR